MEKNRKLPGKVGLMLSQLVLLSVLFSCSKGDLQEPLSSSGNPSAAISESSEIGNVSALSSNLLYEETFDGSSFFESYVHTQFPTSYSWTQSTAQAYQGTKSGRVELRETDPIVTSSGVRSEILFPEPTERERWYSFAVYFPSTTYAYDSDNDILNQWHQEGSPAMSFRTKADRFLIKVGNTKETRKDFDLGVQTKNVWHTFVFHVKHSASSDGLVEVFHNGVKKLTINGGNMYNLSEIPRWKVGLYKDAWGHRETDTKSRVFFYDNIRVGKSTATLEQMLGGATTTTPPPTTPTEPTEPIAPTPTSTDTVTFTLVNAATEKDVMSLKNGATISLSALNLSKMSIRATPPATFTGSVKFALSGTQSYSLVDNYAPYALFGDDRMGNYYYGNASNWNPWKVGTYTLVATAYQNDNAQGTAGSPTKITFTIVN